MITLTQALSDAGRLGGTSRSKAKIAAARANGKHGGRPPNVRTVQIGAHTIHIGNVLRVLPALPNNSFDACLCDPPYELSFMDKHWDASGIAFKIPMWKEVYRIMAPGAYLLAFGGSKTFHHLTHAIQKAGFEVRDHLMWIYGQGMPKSKASLKPSYEPIVLGRKPVGRVRDLAIDACRVGDAGRWPANLILDGEVAKLLDQQSGERRTSEPGAVRRRTATVSNSMSGPLGVRDMAEVAYGDTGGASRFFYCAKASQKERNAGLYRLPLKTKKTLGEYQHPSIGRTASKSGSPAHNFHPTVKPLDLCRWLATLIKPVGKSKLLVPFCGSGSEMIGGIQAEWDEVVGIDVNNEYVQMPPSASSTGWV